MMKLIFCARLKCKGHSANFSEISITVAKDNIFGHDIVLYLRKNCVRKQTNFLFEKQNFFFRLLKLQLYFLGNGANIRLGNKALNRRTPCSNIFYCYENNNQKLANDICFCSVFDRCKENNFQS